MRSALTRPTLVLVGAHGADRTDRSRALSPEAAAALLPALRAVDGVHEAAVLATCHRLEIYLVADDGSPADAVVGRGLGRWHLTGSIAASHLLRVACGLDSPILGDGQILGQVRRAYLTARAAKATGPWLNKLFETALCAGKRARQTSLGRGATTTASAAVQVADAAAGGLAGRRVLVVGAGETASLAARQVARRHPAGLVIANRSRVHAERVASAVQASVIALDQLPEALADADLVISATARGALVITAPMVERAMAARSGRPLLAVDLAVPGDIEATAALIPGVTRIDLDRVTAAATTGLASRLASVPQVEAIVVDRLRALEEWQTGAAAASNARARRDGRPAAPAPVA